MWINQEEQLTQTAQPKFPRWEKEASKPLAINPLGVVVAGETLSLTGEFIGETHSVLECTQNHPPRNQHQKGPICLWVQEEVTESQQRADQVLLFPLRPLPHMQHHNAAMWVASRWKIPKSLIPTMLQAH